MSKKHKRYDEYVTTYNFKRDIEQANFFYVGYANGYADSQEDNYNESDKAEKIIILKQEIEELKSQLVYQKVITEDFFFQNKILEEKLAKAIEVIELLKDYGDMYEEKRAREFLAEIKEKE